MRQVKTALKYYEKGNDEVRRNKYYICEKECVKRSRWTEKGWQEIKKYKWITGVNRNIEWNFTVKR